jgi:cytochrome P450
MRFYPVVHFNEKMAAADTVLKLSRPMVLKDGSRVDEVPCPKGTIVYADIVSYNYSTAIFGPDADEFRPERWLNPSVFESRTGPSVYAGLFNFVAGPK